MKKTIFIRCLLIVLVSILVVFASGIGITYVINKELINERLITEVKIASSLIYDQDDLEGLERFYNDNSCRVTVISLDGDVLFESDTLERLENHIDREEVMSAISGTPKTVERYSETFACMMTYYAIPIEFSDGSEAILRLAIRSAEMNSYILSAIPFLLITLIISAIVAGIFSKKLSEKVARRITEISASLRSVSDGTYVPLSIDKNDGEFMEVYNEINDINEKTLKHLKNEESERERLNKILYAEKELARQKEEFFANASHELKTPLTAMVGLAEISLAKELDESTRKHIERIHKESLRLSDLISDMLKLSRFENVRENEPSVIIDVKPIAEEVLSELSESIKAKNITVSLLGNAHVSATEKRVYELLQNLCSNAVNYNKQDGKIEVILYEDNNISSITVKDTGIGISEENIPHLCERFYRVDKSRSKKTGGTGLGLAIVKHICALYAAKFTINSELGVGTEVCVCFSKNR